MCLQKDVILVATRLKKVLGLSLAGLFLLFNIENQIICGGMILMTHCVCVVKSGCTGHNSTKKHFRGF